MILYHGSCTVIQSPNIVYSRERLDFGKGFYLTNICDQARSWALRFRYRKCPCIVNVFELDYESVQKNYRINRLPTETEEFGNRRSR